MRAPGRRVIWATWPSTQTRPSRPIQSPIFWRPPVPATGCSGGWSRAVASVTAARRRTVRAGRGRPHATLDRYAGPSTRPYDGSRDRQACPAGQARAATAPASTARCRRSRRRSSSTAPPIYVRKEIVHNKHVVETLEAQGAIFVEETDEVPEGAIVVFSAHGVAPAVHDEAGRASLQTIDATCPLVTKVHHEARRFAARGLRHPAHRPRGPRGGRRHGRRGARPHPAGRRPGGRGKRRRRATRARSSWLSQTTLSVDETMETVGAARASGSRCCRTRPATTSATPPRTGRTRSRRSPPRVRPGDRGRLAQLVELGAPGRGRPRRPARAPRTWSTTRTRSTTSGSTGVSTVGVTTGASVPEDLVRGVLDWLAERGFDDVRGGHHGRGAPDVRAAAGAAARPQGRGARLNRSPHRRHATTTAAAPVPKPRARAVVEHAVHAADHLAEQAAGLGEQRVGRHQHRRSQRRDDHRPGEVGAAHLRSGVRRPTTKKRAEHQPTPPPMNESSSSPTSDAALTTTTTPGTVSPASRGCGRRRARGVRPAAPAPGIAEAGRGCHAGRLGDGDVTGWAPGAGGCARRPCRSGRSSTAANATPRRSARRPSAGARAPRRCRSGGRRPSVVGEHRHGSARTCRHPSADVISSAADSGQTGSSTGAGTSIGGSATVEVAQPSCAGQHLSLERTPTAWLYALTEPVSARPAGQGVARVLGPACRARGPRRTPSARSPRAWSPTTRTPPCAASRSGSAGWPAGHPWSWRTRRSR